MLFETRLTYIKVHGFDHDEVEADENLFAQVADGLGGEQTLATNSTPTLNNVAANLSSTVKGDEGFRIVMDEGETSILVSGTDGYLYLEDKDAGYDISAPFGSLKISEETLDFDVFGRLIAIDMGWLNIVNPGLLIPLRVYDPQNVPKDGKVAALTGLKTGGEKYDIFAGSTAIEVRGFGETSKKILFTTACKVPGKGLRLFLTRYLIDNEHKMIDIDGITRPQPEQFAVFRHYLGSGNIEDCRTVRLKSTIKGETK